MSGKGITGNQFARKNETGLAVSFYISADEIAEMRSILLGEEIMASDENVKKLIRWQIRQIQTVDRKKLKTALSGNGLRYFTFIIEINQLAIEIEKIRAQFFPEEQKYKETPRVKLMRAADDFNRSLQQYQREETDIYTMLYELANVIYYNVQDFQQDHDEESFNDIVLFFCSKINVTPEQGFAACIAKYRCRIANKELKNKNRDKAFALEKNAIINVIN